MNINDIEQMVTAYQDAACFMKSVGFDAIELHFGHGYALCQFISPLTNRRKDRYGGSLENRMRLPLEVLRAVRTAVGPEFPILGKISIEEGVPGGLSAEESYEACRLLDTEGIDAIIPSTGSSSWNPMLMFRGDSILPSLLKYERRTAMRLMMRLASPFLFRSYPFASNYLLEQASRIRSATNCKTIYIGGANTAEDFARLMDHGFDFIQLGRSLLSDPGLPNQMMNKPGFTSRCTHCNECVGTIERAGGITCPPFSSGG